MKHPVKSKNKKLSIMYLYSEIQGFTIATIDSLIDKGADVHLICKDVDNNTPFKVMSRKNLTVYKRSQMNVLQLIRLEREIQPSIIYVSGWQDIGYLLTILNPKLFSKIVVVGFDDQWHGTVKQYVASFLGLFNVFKLFYSNAWVCGPYQYEYARKLGFKKDEIIFDLLSAAPCFNRDVSKNTITLGDSFSPIPPFKLVYVGRFSPEKGVNLLVDAWKGLIKKEGLRGELLLIGNVGDLDIEINHDDNIVIKDFMNQGELIEELSNCSCAVVPSYWDQWGVVLQEYCLLGLPVIVSDSVGARSLFCIDNFNGYEFVSGNVLSLENSISKMINLPNNRLREMAHSSKTLGVKITPNSSAANLLSLIRHVK
jgi:glycosyltransferase involved in cell wall biosynthesis